jgi:hypothetical protein
VPLLQVTPAVGAVPQVLLSAAAVAAGARSLLHLNVLLLHLLHLLLLLLTVFASSCGRFTTPVSQNRHDSPMPIANCSQRSTQQSVSESAKYIISALNSAVTWRHMYM